MDAKPTRTGVQMKLTALKQRVAGMRTSGRHRKKEGDHRSFVRASTPVRSSPSRSSRFEAGDRGAALSTPDFTTHQVSFLHPMLPCLSELSDIVLEH